jgi:hypothetical protein
MGIPTAAAANLGQGQGLDVLAAHLVSIRQQAALGHQIRQTTQDAGAFVAGRDKADLLIRLKPQSWCVAECLDHLTQTTQVFLPAIAQAIAEAPKLTRNRHLKTGILPSLFIRSLNPPYLIRFKVLPQLAPPQLSSEEAWSRFSDSQTELLATLNSAAGLAIDEVRIKSPVYARISYNIYGVFCMLAAHQRRHVWQIGNILQALDNRPAPPLPKYSA